MTEDQIQTIVAQVAKIVDVSLDAAAGDASKIRALGDAWAEFFRLLMKEGV